MSQEDKSNLNWSLMQLIVLHSKCSIIDVAENKEYSTIFHLLELTIDKLTK